MINIPLESTNKDEFPLKKAERMIVAYAVLFGADNQTAFMRFHPEFTNDGKTLNQAGKVASRQFWSWGKVKDYRDSYIKTVQEFLNGKKSAVKSEAVSIDDSRKDRALKSLLNQAMSMVEGGADLDADTLKTITEIFKKLNILKDEVEQQEKPRRYLPVRCGECDYRSFVESYVEKGEIENTCLRCKALAIAEEHGFHYDPKKLLNPINPNNDEQNN